MEIREQVRSFLSSIAPITNKEFSETISYFQPLSLSKGEYFVQSGEICRRVAFISSGILRSYYINDKGNEVTYCFCIGNNFTTSFKSFLAQTASVLSIQALEPTELLTINYEDLHYLYAHFPIWQHIGRVATEKEYLELERYASVLNNETAKQKYLRLLNEQPVIIQKAPLQDIASYLGVSRETLSRIRKQTAG